MGTRGVRHFCLFGEGVKQSCALVGEGERNQVLVSQTTRNIDRLITPRWQCWAFAPILAPPRHWRYLKKVEHVAVEQMLKKWRGGSDAKIKWLAISEPNCA